MEPGSHPRLADSRTWTLFTMSPAKEDPPAKTPRREETPKERKGPEVLREESLSVKIHQEDERALESEDTALTAAPWTAFCAAVQTVTPFPVGMTPPSFKRPSPSPVLESGLTCDCSGHTVWREWPQESPRVQTVRGEPLPDPVSCGPETPHEGAWGALLQSAGPHGEETSPPQPTNCHLNAVAQERLQLTLRGAAAPGPDRRIWTNKRLSLF